MAATKWGSVWGSVWGGGDLGGYSLSLDTFLSNRANTSSLWLADGAPAGTTDLVGGSVESGDVIGWAPAVGAEFSLAGHFSGVIVYDQFSEETYPWSFYVLTSSRVASKVYMDAEAFENAAVHAELYGHENVTTAPHAGKPAFVVFSKAVGGEIEARNIRLEDPTTLTTATAWDNELDVEVSACRFVSLPGRGTVIVAVAPSTVYAGDGLWLKSTFGSGEAEPAVEVKLDLRPSDAHTVDLSRLHVTETKDCTLVFHYAVYATASGYATASFSYNPVHASYTTDLAFDSTGIMRRPRVVCAGYVPVVAQKGSRRHAVTNDAMMALEPAGTTQGNVVAWFKHRGYTKVLNAPTIVWDAVTHPYLFGGKLKTAVPSREIKIISVGWADTRQGGQFRVIGAVKLGAAVAGQGDAFKNYFRTNGAAIDYTWRLCLGAIYAPPEVECNSAGYHSCLAISSHTRIDSEESHRSGYNTNFDLFSAAQLLRLNSVSQMITPAEVGLAGTVSGGVISAPGLVGSSAYFPNANSSISIEYADISAESLVVSFWVHPELSSRVGDDDQFSIARRAADATDSWRFWWLETTKEIKFFIGLDGGIGYELSTAVLGELRENTWYKITGVYDADVAIARLYVDGCLVAEQAAAPGKVLRNPTSATDILLGDDGDVARSSFLGRIDDFVVGDGTGVDQQVVAQEFQLGLLSRDFIPQKSSRSTNYNFQDAVVATASISGDPYSNRYYTFNLRKMSVNAIKSLRGNFCVDVWQHANGSDPVFMGCVAPPWQVLYKKDDLVPGSGYIQTVSVESDVTVCGIKAIRAEDTLTNNVTLYFLVTQDAVDVTSPVRAQIWRMTLDPLSVVENAKQSSNYELVAELDDGGITAFEPIFVAPTSGTDGSHVVLVATTESPDNKFYIVDSSNFGAGALAASNSKTVLQMAPSVGVGFSHFATNYEDEYTDSTQMTIRGIVAREVSAGQGLGDSALGGLLVYYGICSNLGNSIPATSEPVQLVSTVVALIPPEAILGAFSFYQNGSPRQWDQRGIGGVDPFVPLSWVQNPLDSLRESFILGKSGIRPTNTPGVHGSGDLLVYRVDNTGVTGLVPVIVAGPDIESGHLCDNATMCVSTSSFDDSSPNVFLHVSRPAYSGYDEFSPIQITQKEALQGNWYAYSYTSATPVLRRNDRPTSSATYTYVVSLRNMTWNKSGPTVLAGATSKAILSIQWGDSVLT